MESEILLMVAAKYGAPGVIALGLGTFIYRKLPEQYKLKVKNVMSLIKEKEPEK